MGKCRTFEMEYIAVANSRSYMQGFAVQASHLVLLKVDGTTRCSGWHPGLTDLLERWWRMCAQIAHLQKAHGGSSTPQGFDYTVPNNQPFISDASKQASSNSQQQWHLVPQKTLQPLISMC